MWRIRVYFKIGKSVDRYQLPTSITYMKDIIIHTYIVTSAVALWFLHNDLKETSAALKDSQNIIKIHQRALESHKKVIMIHDEAIGLIFDHFLNTRV